MPHRYERRQRVIDVLANVVIVLALLIIVAAVAPWIWALLFR